VHVKIVLRKNRNPTLPVLSVVKNSIAQPLHKRTPEADYSFVHDLVKIELNDLMALKMCSQVIIRMGVEVIGLERSDHSVQFATVVVMRKLNLYLKYTTKIEIVLIMN